MAINFTGKQWREHALKHKILVVDDEDFKRGEVAGIALANGFFCNYARSAHEAWTMLDSGETTYEILITDNSMPTHGEPSPDGYNYATSKGLVHLGDKSMSFGNEGLQLIRRVRSDSRLSGLDIIMYSGSGEVRQAEEFGATFIRPSELYLLNDMLRERSELYQQAAQDPKAERKGGLLGLLKR